MPRRKRYLRPQQGGVGSGAAAGQGGILEGILGSATGGILGAQDSSNDFGQNQAVTEPYASPGAGAQYYSEGGQVTNQPFQDTRNWWERNIRHSPDQAANLNQYVAAQGAIQQNAIPGQLRLAQGQADISRKSALEQFEQEQAYNAGQVADVNPLYNNPALAGATEPSQVPFQYSIDPQRAITERNMPFVGDTSGGKRNNAEFVMGNVKAEQAGKEARLREIAAANRAFLGSTGQAPVGENLAPSPEQLQIGADIRGAELERTRATTKNLTKPAFHFERGGTGEPSFIFQEGEGKLFPYATYGAQGALTPEGKRNTAAGQPFYKQLENNIPYNQGSGSTNNLKGAASTQGQEFVTAPGSNGGPPSKQVSTGAPSSPPRIDISSRPSVAQAPSLEEFNSPEIEAMVQEEAKRRMQQMIQQRAWGSLYGNPGGFSAY